MPTMPSWFPADQVYETPDGWYVGARQGFRVGPYPDRQTARARSSTVTAALRRCRDTAEMVRAVRTFLHDESQLNAAPDAAAQNTPVQGSVATKPPARTGESPRVWFRTERFFFVDDVWFFSTRENIDVGPYESKEVAELECKRLIRLLQDASSDVEARLTIHQFKTRPVIVA